jgi:Cysteine-rich CWC
MSKHAPAECPRCGNLFECKANTPQRCDCVKIKLTPSEILFIRTEMMDDEDCLCGTCLDDLRHLCAIKAKSNPIKTP